MKENAGFNLEKHALGDLMIWEIPKGFPLGESALGERAGIRGLRGDGSTSYASCKGKGDKLFPCLKIGECVLAAVFHE